MRMFDHPNPNRQPQDAGTVSVDYVEQAVLSLVADKVGKVQKVSTFQRDPSPDFIKSKEALETCFGKIKGLIEQGNLENTQEPVSFKR